MFFQLILLALLPFATTATPILERSDKYKPLFCFHKGQDQMYSINDNLTKGICTTLSSGTYLKHLVLSPCRVADHDVAAFKEHCESHNSKSDPTEWKAGSKLDVVWDPKEPYDLYCFVEEVTFDESKTQAGIHIASDATPDVCHALKSGKYQDNKKSCRVAKEDVDGFHKKCLHYYPTGYPPSYSTWIPGTALKPSM
ncbi:Hypothetical allergen [Malassezia sympodialis ATCC 42132]|uniref:Uncharacterized protein n=1 Tax=Malassezia sympodialis (strain ATCC 42132) TaxID=1230383 RepID=M5EE16_MALS4|nr:putative allergen [Malassezia sympodialis ATCC 42132]CCV00733.1 Hypothetical allergen [Malassezia sympodialis ATCC 42132]SHO76565.1 Hypothetical protein MSYG_0903 [Malassezia sympodialis ATCC 42132]|eukprot:XP_018741910.1 Hypothetical allergen [Malassezia sympodialis ATCC 42132]